MTRVGICTFGCDGGRSGIGQYAANLIRQFAAMDGPVQFEVIAHEDEAAEFVPPDGGVEALLLPSALKSVPRNLLWHQISLPALCRQRQYDVLFLPAGNRRLPAGAPCPTVGTVHDFSTLHVEDKYDPLRKFYITRALPWLMRRLSHVVTVSESSRADIVAYARVPEERISVVPEAADGSRYFPRDPAEARSRTAARYGVAGRYLLYVSRIEHPGKNHVRLIEAFERLTAGGAYPGLTLLLAGSDWSGAADVHRRASASPCVDRIVFTGFVPGADLPDLYAGAEAFVFPSLYEGFGLPILEAMRSGAPVACADRSSLPEVGGDAVVYFDPEDSGSICDGLVRALDPATAGELRAAGLRRSAGFTWERAASETLEILLQAAHSRCAAAAPAAGRR